MEHHHTPAFFVRGPSHFARLVFYAALSLTLMATDARLHYLTEVRQGLVALLHPLEILASMPSNLYIGARDYLVTHDTLLKDNHELTQQSLQQNVQLQRLQSLEAENAHLRDLLKTKQSLAQPTQLAEIVHMGRDPFTQKVTVNLGSRENVAAGQAVVDGAGVIGQVTQVYPFSSEVTLITDKDLAIPIQIERNGLRAIAFGHGRDNIIDLPYLPANVDIRKGDKLVTSGIDGVYPLGLAVAYVSQIEHTQDSPFAHIVCTPVAGIESHRQILLLSLPKSDAALEEARINSANSAADKHPTPAPHHAGH